MTDCYVTFEVHVLKVPSKYFYIKKKKTAVVQQHVT